MKFKTAANHVLFSNTCLFYAASLSSSNSVFRHPILLFSLKFLNCRIYSGENFMKYLYDEKFTRVIVPEAHVKTCALDLSAFYG
jgi:hypothetical protein